VLYENRRRLTKLAVHQSWRNHRMPGNRNVLYLIIGALIVAVGVLGYNLYQTNKEPEGVQINVGPDGLKIKTK
jgi:RsiW-degrading membrane proteinase PrsW (M82 family)